MLSMAIWLPFFTFWFAISFLNVFCTMKMKNCFIAFLSKKGREFLLQSKINVRWRLMYINVTLSTWENSMYNECDSWRTNLVPVRFLTFKLLEFSNISNQIKGNFNWTQWFLKKLGIWNSTIFENHSLDVSNTNVCA